MRLRAYVKDIYTRGGQVSRESTMALTGISEAGSGDLVCTGKSVVFNKHAKQAGVSTGDSIEFEANVSIHEGKTIITSPRDFRRIGNY